MQGGIACRAVLRLDLANEFVETGFVRDVGARELKDALALEGVFEGFFADGTFATNECSFSPQAASVRGAGHDVVFESSDFGADGSASSARNVAGRMRVQRPT